MFSSVKGEERAFLPSFVASIAASPASLLLRSGSLVWPPDLTAARQPNRPRKGEKEEGERKETKRQKKIMRLENTPFALC